MCVCEKAAGWFKLFISFVPGRPQPSHGTREIQEKRDEIKESWMNLRVRVAWVVRIPITWVINTPIIHLETRELLLKSKEGVMP